MKTTRNNNRRYGVTRVTTKANKTEARATEVDSPELARGDGETAIYDTGGAAMEGRMGGVECGPITSMTSRWPFLQWPGSPLMK